MKKKTFWDNEKLVILLPYLLLVVVHILMTIPMRVPVVWPDEYGYLFYARYIAGLFLTTPLPKVEFIGTFGYSLLIAPIYWLFQDNFTTYKAILIFNSFLSSSLYIAIFLFIKYFFKGDNKNAFWTALLTSFYPAYMLQSNIAYTDAFTPAYFLFTIFLFYYFLKKRNVLWGVLFSFALGFFSWIHIRFIPLPIIAIVFIFILANYKILPKFSSFVSIIILTAFLISTILIGDYLTFKITGTLRSEEKILISLLNVSEIFLLFASIFLLSIFIYKRNLYSIISFFVSLFIGFLISIDQVFYILIPLYFLISLIFRSKLNVSLKLTIYCFIMMLIISTMFYISVPNIEYIGVVLNRIRIWFINASGNIFYAIYATYLLALVGFLFLVWRLWNAGKDSGITDEEEFDLEIVTQLKFSSKIFVSKPKNIALFFFLVSAVMMYVITIFPREVDANHYRADHLFYGRYLEVMLAGFLAIGIFKSFKKNLIEYLPISIISVLFYSFITIILILTYGNVITSEMEFRSSFSFFPLRGFLGNINIFLYALYAILFGILIMVFAKIKPIISRILLIGLFLSFSVVSYYYVLVYQNLEQQSKNRIPMFIKENFSDLDTISYDLRLNKEMSRNAHNYIFQLQDKFFQFFSLQENPLSELVIAEKDINYRKLSNAMLLDVEFGGFDYLWLNPDLLKDSTKKLLVPSYYNLPLNKEWVAGVYRNGFYKKRWINGKAEIKFNFNNPDTVMVLRLVVSCSNPKGQELIIWYENDEIFKYNIGYGVWEYEFKFSSRKPLANVYFKFFSDLTTENNKLVGIAIDSFFIKPPKEEFYIERRKEKSNNTNLNGDISAKIWFRRNIDVTLLELKPGDTLSLPVTIKNTSKNVIKSDSLNKCYLIYRWLNFAWKSVEYTSPAKYYLKEDLYPGEEIEIFIDFIAPPNYKKYFLEFALARKEKETLNNIYIQKIHPIFDLREKTLEKQSSIK